MGGPRMIILYLGYVKCILAIGGLLWIRSNQVKDRSLNAKIYPIATNRIWTAGQIMVGIKKQLIKSECASVFVYVIIIE